MRLVAIALATTLAIAISSVFWSGANVEFDSTAQSGEIVEIGRNP